MIPNDARSTPEEEPGLLGRIHGARVPEDPVDERLQRIAAAKMGENEATPEVKPTTEGHDHD